MTDDESWFGLTIETYTTPSVCGHSGGRWVRCLVKYWRGEDSIVVWQGKSRPDLKPRDLRKANKMIARFNKEAGILHDG